jgi:hypothetical protein
MGFFGLVTQADLNNAVNTLLKRMGTLATQDDVNALTAAIEQVETDLQTAATNIQSELDALASANPTLDLTALQDAVTPLDDQVNALGNLKPTPPATP